MDQFQREVCALMATRAIRDLLQATPADATKEWQRFHANLALYLYEMETGRRAVCCAELERRLLSEGRALMTFHALKP
jgi:hypothetical protein